MARSSDSDKLALWRERFEGYSSSGLTVARFCARERVSVATFYNWRRKLGAASAGRRESPPRRDAFRPVDVVGSVAGVSIHLPCGTHIEVYAGHLDAVRAVIGEVVRAGGGPEKGVSPC